MTDYVCELQLADSNEAEIGALVGELKARFGQRLRTKTSERWLVELQRAPARPPQLVHQVTAAEHGKARKLA